MCHSHTRSRIQQEISFASMKETRLIFRKEPSIRATTAAAMLLQHQFLQICTLQQTVTISSSPGKALQKITSASTSIVTVCFANSHILTNSSMKLQQSAVTAIRSVSSAKAASQNFQTRLAVQLAKAATLQRMNGTTSSQTANRLSHGKPQIILKVWKLTSSTEKLMKTANTNVSRSLLQTRQNTKRPKLLNLVTGTITEWLLTIRQSNATQHQQKLCITTIIS